MLAGENRVGGRGSSERGAGSKACGGEEAAVCTSHRALQTRGTDKWSCREGWEETKEAGRREDYRSARNNKEEERGEEKIMQGLKGQKSQLQKDYLKDIKPMSSYLII